MNARAENHARNEPYTKCNAFVTSLHRNPQRTKKCNAFINAQPTRTTATHSSSIVIEIPPLRGARACTKRDVTKRDATKRAFPSVTSRSGVFTAPRDAHRPTNHGDARGSV